MNAYLCGYTILRYFWEYTTDRLVQFFGPGPKCLRTRKKQSNIILSDWLLGHKICVLVLINILLCDPLCSVGLRQKSICLVAAAGLWVRCPFVNPSEMAPQTETTRELFFSRWSSTPHRSCTGRPSTRSSTQSRPTQSPPGTRRRLPSEMILPTAGKAMAAFLLPKRCP